MVINWYGEGCFKIQTGGLTLLIDPFSSEIGLTPPRGKVDAVLNTLTKWPPEQENNKEEQGQIIIGPGEYDVQDMVIRGFGLTKESVGGVLKSIYLVNVEDMNLCFLGHITDYPDENILDKIKNIDILFVPSAGAPYISQELAAKFVKQFNPKIIVNSLFKIPGLKRKTDDEKDFAKELGLKEEVEEKLVVKKKDLVEGKIRLVSLKV